MHRLNSIWSVCGVLLGVTAATPPSTGSRDLVFQWTNAALQGVRDAKLSAPVVARSLAIVHTCMYDAWAAYDDSAIGTQMGGLLRRPAVERTLQNKEQAISYAAFRGLRDVPPADTQAVYVPLMRARPNMARRTTCDRPKSLWRSAPA
jgi:hypothetical protein